MIVKLEVTWQASLLLLVLVLANFPSETKTNRKKYALFASDSKYVHIT